MQLGAVCDMKSLAVVSMVLPSYFKPGSIARDWVKRRPKLTERPSMAQMRLSNPFHVIYWCTMASMRPTL